MKPHEALSWKVVSDADRDGIYDVIGYFIKSCIIWTSKLNFKKKISGPFSNTFDCIPLHLTFQGDVVQIFLRTKTSCIGSFI